jgi:P pilus assembly chaperone PapD
MIKSFKKTAIAICFAMVLCLLLAGQAQANLMVAPLRVVFNDRDRSAVVTLINNSDKEATYEVGWALYRMNENGSQTEVPMPDKADPFAVSEIVKFSPRQVRMEANGRQRVRLSLRRPPDLPAGEYRAHLIFSKLPDLSDLSPEQRVRGARTMLRMKVSTGIPVIIRQGSGDGDGEVISATLEKPSSANKFTHGLAVEVKRTTPFSPYGRIRVYQKDASGKEQMVSFLNNVAIYPEIEKRRAVVPLKGPIQGEVRVAYEGATEYGGIIFDEKTFNIN